MLKPICCSRYFLGLLILSIFCISCQKRTKVKRNSVSMLIIKEQGEENESDFHPVIQAILAAGEEEAIHIHTCTHPLGISQDSILQFSAVILCELTLDQLHPAVHSRIERYMEAGGGVINIENKLNMPYTWPWYEQVLAQAEQGKGESTGNTVMKTNNTASESPFLQASLSNGRVLVADKRVSNLSDGELKPFIKEAIHYAVGDNSYDPALISSPEAPEDNRFTKIVLDQRDINEPMELAVMPDGKVIFIERRGKMKLYDPAQKSSKVIATFDVCTEGNYEDGLLGLALDPKFEENHYLYLYYSPPCETWSQYLSRFTMYGTDSINLESEKVILEVPVQRETCCHSGGSVTFDAEGNLYLSTGDNTSSKESDGFTPIDERPGRYPFDAQKSSGNTNDLRGKILRITPNEYGDYSIPDGNLFPEEDSLSRPEIYVMGARNPFRISVDHKTGYVYWGDVGPDVAEPGKYGPESFDEWNQARTAGNYGWPYFIGNNYAYPDRDFAEDTLAGPFDPSQPINNSPNNTGYQKLPEARPAFIWYPKRRSDEFPMLAQGSNSAMAGPIYYSDMFPEDSRVKFPSYYDGKLFIYEWARSWLKVVTMNETGDLVRIEPFLPHERFVKPIDMEFGPDGAMYMLEYGKNYFMNNPEAKLVKIEYAAKNRLPFPMISLDKREGAAPHTVKVSALDSYDYDYNDSLTFSWHFTDTTYVQRKGAISEFTFEQNGVYRIRLKATDSAGESAITETEIRVGNEPPVIDLALAGNQEFYLDRAERAYRIGIEDAEDVHEGGINQDNLSVNFVYVSEGEDLEVTVGDPSSKISGSIRFTKGKNLINSSDCTSCHNVGEKNIGPSYISVSNKYKNDPKAINYLARKIISGGNGVWGEKIMPGHPQHSFQETKSMAEYILSLTDERYNGKLPTQGTIKTNQHKSSDLTGAYLLAATYTDQGANGIEPISRRAIKILKSPHIEAEDFIESGKMSTRTFGDAKDEIAVAGIRNKGYALFPEMDLTDIYKIRFKIKPIAGGTLNIYVEESEGTLLGTIKIPPGSSNADWRIYETKIIPMVGKQRLYIEFVRNGNTRSSIASWDWMKFTGSGRRIVF